MRKLHITAKSLHCAVRSVHYSLEAMTRSCGAAILPVLRASTTQPEPSLFAIDRTRMNRATLAERLFGTRSEPPVMPGRRADAGGGGYAGKKLLGLVQKLVRTGSFEPNDFVIAGSARIFIAGKRSWLSDLDIVARGSTWEEAKRLVTRGKGYRTRGSISGDEVVRLYGDRIEVCDRWFMEGSDTDQLIECAEVHRGLRFFSIDQVIEYKSHLDRPKDRDDLAALSTSWAPSRNTVARRWKPTRVVDTTGVPV